MAFMMLLSVVSAYEIETTTNGELPLDGPIPDDVLAVIEKETGAKYISTIDAKYLDFSKGVRWYFLTLKMERNGVLNRCYNEVVKEVDTAPVIDFSNCSPFVDS